MSYCRFGEDSDVYLYKHVGGPWVCCGCRLHAAGSWMSRSLMEVKTHLEEHVKAGHRVPDYAVDRVSEELGS